MASHFMTRAGSRAGGAAGTLSKWFHEITATPRAVLAKTRHEVAKVAGHSIGGSVTPALTGAGLGLAAASLKNGLDMHVGGHEVPLDGVIALGVFGSGDIHEMGKTALGILAFRKTEEFVRRRRALKHGVMAALPAGARVGSPAVAAHGDPIVDFASSFS